MDFIRQTLPESLAECITNPGSFFAAPAGDENEKSRLRILDDLSVCALSFQSRNQDRYNIHSAGDRVDHLLRADWSIALCDFHQNIYL